MQIRIKIHQIPHVMFGTKSQFFFKLCITLQCHVMYFSSKYLYALDKWIQSKRKFLDFPLFRLKFTKFVMSFFKQKVSFSSKFESFFNVMRDNSSVVFRLKPHVLLGRVVHQNANFQTCHCSH